MLEGDVINIINFFHSNRRSSWHLLLRETCLLGCYFTQVRIRHAWKKANMCTDHMANEGILLETKIIWYKKFPNRLVDLVMRDVSATKYE